MSEDFSDTPLVRTKCPVDAMASPHYIFASWKNIVTSLKNEVDDDSAKKISLYGEVWMLQYIAIRKKNLRYGQKDISKSRKPLYPADMKTGRKNGTADKIEERTRAKEEVKKGIWNQKKVLCLIMMLLGNVSRDGKGKKGNRKRMDRHIFRQRPVSPSEREKVRFIVITGIGCRQLQVVILQKGMYNMLG